MVKINKQNKEGSAKKLVSKNLKTRITTSVMAQLFSQLCMGLAGIFVLKIITNKLGLHDYGIYATCFVFVTTFTIFTELGVNSIAAREIAKTPSKASEIISHNISLRLFLAIIMIPIISGVGFIFYPHVGRTIHIGILIMSFYLLFDALGSTSIAYFGAKVRNDLPAIISIAQQLLFLLSVIVVALLGFGIYGFLGAYVFSAAVGAIATLSLVKKYIYINPRINLKAWRKILGMSISLGIFSIIYTMYLKTDSILLSIMRGTSAVGLYTVAYSIVNVSLYFSGYLMIALTPSLAVAKKEEFNHIIQKAFHFMAIFSCLLVVGGLILRKNAVLLVSNKVFSKAADPLAILALATVFSYFYSIFSYASVAINKHHKMIFISIVSLFLNLGINLIFIPRFGIVGAAWATVITEFIAMIAGYHLFKKQTNVKIHLRIIMKPLFAALCSLALGLVFYNSLSKGNALLDCILASAIIVCPYFIILYFIGGLPEEIKDGINKVLRVFIKGYS